MNYDFTSIDDKEFEALCCDLIGADQEHRIERFKSGKDGGVDARFFSSEGQEVILQCKHWRRTGLNPLIARIKKEEKRKVDKLKPSRYLFATSVELSRADKQKIAELFSPHIKRGDDVYGAEDLNQLLSKNSAIHQQHFKLWLHSVDVLSQLQNKPIFERTLFEMQEARRLAPRYVRTQNHVDATALLEQRKLLIICGEPGVGKTTLASQICLEYLANGCQVFKIASQITEVEQVWDDSSSQLFYFDDFLGANYLQALNGYEGSQITSFMRRVKAASNKFFVLTSRSSVLNQGKQFIQALTTTNTNKFEYVMRVRCPRDQQREELESSG
jgi:Restriction endonuclease